MDQQTTISSCISRVTLLLKEAGITTARLDSELLTGYVLGHDRSYVIAHGDDALSDKQLLDINNLVAKRLQRMPIAYLTGHKEFYGRDFIVTHDVLIPRPESETIIDILKVIYQERDAGRGTREDDQYQQENAWRILDVGCGSGCLGITAKLELPQSDVTISDIDENALHVARQNAKTLGADVSIVQSNLLDTVAPSSKIQNPKSKIYFDIIIANLPYVDASWERSPETDHEPALALFASDKGLELIKKCIQQSQGSLAKNGYLLLEADPCQHEEIIEYGKHFGFTLIEVRDYIVVLRRDGEMERPRTER